jgi:hypothetical protein
MSGDFLSVNACTQDSKNVAIIKSARSSILEESRLPSSTTSAVQERWWSSYDAIVFLISLAALHFQNAASTFKNAPL